MSDANRPPEQDRSAAPVSARSGCLTAFLILAGIVLLLPGLCAIAMIAFDWKSALSASNVGVMVTFLVISAGGIIMIREGIRGPRR